jgi:hypothetical protein
VYVALVALVVFCLTMLGSEIGYRIGRRISATVSPSVISEQTTLQASLLGLLALLLGFTFGMAESRYDERRLLVIDEANAIGTASLRTRTVPAPEGTEIQRILEDYVDARLALYRAGRATAEEEQRTSARVETVAWARAAELAQRDPRSVPAGLLLQSLNEVIDLNAKRIELTHSHVPLEVLLTLVLVAAVALGWVGAGLAFCHRRGFATTLLLSLLIAGVTAVIVDLDQPQRGLIHVSETSLIELQRKLAAGGPQ